MRVLGALGLMATNAAAVAASASAPLALQSDLFYATSSACASLSALPVERDLSGALLPTEHFHGTVKLTKTDATAPSSGCVLHLEVEGELAQSKEAPDAFALVGKVDMSLANMVAAHVLRGSDGLKDLTLQRLRVKLGDDRDYVVDTLAQSDEATAGEITLNGKSCGDFATQEFLADILPVGSDRVAVVPGDEEASECAVGVNILGRVPPFSSTNDATALLKSLDDSINDWFGDSSTKQSSAALTSAHVALSPAKEAVQEGLQTAVMTTTLASGDRMNAPTKQITLGVLMGITVLSAMLFGISYQKRRHEQGMQARHDNASRAAQIRRVSYRMGYEPIDASDKHRFGAEEEEKDGLL